MFVVGLDIGYGNMKVVTGASDGPPAIDMQVYPVGAGPRAQVNTNVRGEINGGVSVRVDGEDYIAGIEPDELANWKRALHANYPSSTPYRALLYAALKQTERATVNRLVTGLPVSHFLDMKKREALKKSLTKVHDVDADRSVRVEETLVFPQPVGSYLDVSIAAGRQEEFETAEILVIDPGFFSVDWVYLSNTKLKNEWSGSSELATSHLLEEVVGLVNREYDFRISVDKLERLIRKPNTTYLPIPKQKVLIADVLQTAASKVGPAVMNELQSSMRTRQNDINFVVLSGGGAQYYESAVRAIFPKAEVLIPKNPVTANACGFWYLGASLD